LNLVFFSTEEQVTKIPNIKSPKFVALVKLNMLECVSSPESPSEGIPGKGIFSRTNCCHNCKVLRRNEHRTGGVHSVADTSIPLTTLRYPVLLLDFPPRFSPSNRVKLHRELISLRVPLLLFAFIAFAFGWPDKNE